MKLNEILTPTLAELREEFRFISQSTYRGISGVYVADSGKPGPTVGITIMTHGNEPSGLASCWYLRNHFRIQKRLRSGRVIFVLNNLRAARRYFAAKSKKQKAAARFCDLNMNRLPENLRTRKPGTKYEIKRARALLPIWLKFNSALDIHSETRKESEPMIIEVNSNRRIARLIRNFPILMHFADVEQHQLRKPMLTFCGNPKKRIPAVGIEAGSHESPLAYRVATACVLAFVDATGLLHSNLELPVATRRTTYRFVGRVLFPDMSWSLVKVFRKFDSIRKGQILATNEIGGVIRAPVSGVVIFPPEGLKPRKAEDEVMFIARKMS